ncbi:MAG: transcriptional regulator with XRE-family HTH domain [Cellvibrionaceae bacterium]|jgi:transcriptional regulator with XRE-family HTH domain
MTDEINEDISLRLQQLRKMYGLSQRELAKRAGVTNSSVSMIEQGRVSPSISSMGKLLQGIPMTLRDFFSFNPQNQSSNFYRSFELFQGTEDGIDSYRLGQEKPKDHNELIYRVFNPGSDTGTSMLIAKSDCSGFVVQGSLDVMINNQCQTLEAGDGFFVDVLYPYRLRNVSDQKAIVVICHHSHS